MDLTVLMPVYNSGVYLSAAIDSILGQTYRSFELLIIDDCSTDGSRQLIEGYKDPRIRLVVNEQNIGQTRSLNRGLQLVDTDLVARMDHDDISHPQRFEKQVDFLNKTTDIAVVGTHIRWIDAAGRVIGKKRMPEDALVLKFAQLFRCPLAHGTVMFRKHIIFEELGGYDESIPYSQDWQLWARVLNRYQITNVPEFLVDIRVHEAATSSLKRREIAEENYGIYKLSIQQILEVEPIPPRWVSALESLASMKMLCYIDMIEMGKCLYVKFCHCNPAARTNLGVVGELAIYYLRILYHSRSGLFKRIHMAQLMGRKIATYAIKTAFAKLKNCTS